MYARDVYNFIKNSIETNNFPDEKLIIHWIQIYTGLIGSS
jgi:hypothetical protein